MLHYVRGNLFDSPAEAWVNTVNIEGVMGKGIALAFKRLFPRMYAEYRDLCDSKQLRIGSLHYYRAPNRLIINFPTKTTWRRPSSVSYIEKGLQTFVASYERYGVTSVAFPPLGCGNGELNFERDVRPLIERYLRPLPISVFVYPPQAPAAVAEHRTPEEMERWIARENALIDADAVWHDVVHMIGQGRQFQTIDKSFGFRASVISQRHYMDEETEIVEDLIALEVPETDHEPRVVSKADILSAWEYLRSARVLTADAFADATRIGGPVLGILSQLPYLEQMQVDGGGSSINCGGAYALRWQPAENQQMQFALAE